MTEQAIPRGLLYGLPGSRRGQGPGIDILGDTHLADLTMPLDMLQHPKKLWAGMNVMVRIQMADVNAETSHFVDLGDPLCRQRPAKTRIDLYVSNIAGKSMIAVEQWPQIGIRRQRRELGRVQMDSERGVGKCRDTRNGVRKRWAICHDRAGRDLAQIDVMQDRFVDFGRNTKVVTVDHEADIDGLAV